MPTLLIVHHTPSPALHAMFEAILSGTNDPDLAAVDVIRRPALSATAPDVLTADGVILGTPANIGYMSGALKHFFDTVYYPYLNATKAMPFGFYVHGNQGTEGAVNSIDVVTKGLGWKQVAEPVVVLGETTKPSLEACWNLGATVAATLLQ
ncbi:MAG: NAD(P)H-dependent oxidoreductase [Actinomycetota bacterium]|nr:NAD(P)H-dependent oxidoreductase [Actinomycetota bacterium]